MIIAGAGGHARELAGVLAELNTPEPVYFYDDTGSPRSGGSWKHIPVLGSPAAAGQIFETQPAFALGVGRPSLRQLLYERLVAVGGRPFSVISPYARIGSYGVEWEDGLNIMTHAVVTQDVRIGRGTLIHIHATVHHDCRIGRFCELSPGCHLLGNVVLEDLVSVGAGAVVLPGIHVGRGAVIGAGAVVTKPVAAGSIVKGNPAV